MTQCLKQQQTVSQLETPTDSFPHSHSLSHAPLSCTEVSRWASAEVAPICVRAAKLAGVLAGGALVDVRAASTPLLVVEAGGAEAAEAPQGVVTRRSPADLAVQALVLIWVTGSGREVNKQSGHSS